MPNSAGVPQRTSRIAPATSWHPAVAQKREDVPMLLSEGGWRRGRDSNPRGGYKPPTRFPVAFLRPARTPLRTENPHEKPLSRKTPFFAGGQQTRSRRLGRAPFAAQSSHLSVTNLARRRVAEREGFEPSVQFYPYNRLAGGCLQPTRPPLPTILAEGAGFEPAGRRRPAVFKTAAFSRSAIPPANDKI